LVKKKKHFKNNHEPDSHISGNIMNKPIFFT